jgi:hypothetical protein
MRKIFFFYLIVIVGVLLACQCREGVNRETVVLNGIISPGEIEANETFFIKFIWMGGG